jgi:hypothetical protein
MLVTVGYKNVKLTFVCRLHYYELVSVTVRNLFYPEDIARAAVCDVYLTIRNSVFCYANNQQEARDTSEQQLGWTQPDTVNIVKCS